ncbi:MAG: VWA domain-containing protein [Candidatus Bathyarchaeia archaeon]
METKEGIIMQNLNEYIAKIVQKTRVHPEILRGVSPRGSIAFKELVTSLKAIYNGVTKEIIKKAALIALSHRIILKPGVEKTPREIIEEIVEEVFHEKSHLKDYLELSEKDLESILSAIWRLYKAQSSISNTEKNSFSLSEKFVKDLMDKNEFFKELKSKSLSSMDDLEFLRELCETLKDKGYLFSKKIDDYNFTKKALEKLKEFNKNVDEKSIKSSIESIEKAFKNLSNLKRNSILKNTSKLLDNIMDVQNALFGVGITLQDLYVNNILKSNSKKSQLEYDYEKLQVIIDNLKSKGFLKANSGSSIFYLTPKAIDFLLDCSIPALNFKESIIHEVSKKCFNGERTEIKNFSLGDVYRNLSIRHTLKELAKKKKLLKDIEREDLRVFIKKLKQELSTVIAIDVSGSMAKESKLKLAKLIAAGLIKVIINKGGKVALLAFNDLSEILTSYTNDKKLLFELIIQLKASRNTNIGEGIKDSLKLSLKNGLKKSEKHIILISDGQPTATSRSALKDLKINENSVLSEEYAIQEAKKARKHRIKISVIAVGKNNGKGLDFAKKLARVGGGFFYKVSNMNDLNNVIKCEIIRMNK